MNEGEWCDDIQPLDADALIEFDADQLPALVEFDGEKYGTAVTLETRSYSTTSYVRSTADIRHIKDATNDIGDALRPGETRHLLLSGAYTPFLLVHALMAVSGQTIDELWLVTLSHSAANAVDLLSMIDDGTVKKCWLMASHVFSKKNANLYDPLAAGLKERGQHCMVYRTHAKVFLMKMVDGTKYVISGSGNMRSCKSLEQADIYRDDGLYDFHRQWIAGLFDEAVEQQRHEDSKTTSESNNASQGTPSTAKTVGG